MHGHGTAVSKKENFEYILDGEYHDNKLHGDAKVTFGPKSKYSLMIFEGHFENGICKHGKLRQSEDK